MQHWTKLNPLEREPQPVGRSGHAAVCLGYGGRPCVLVSGGRDNTDKVLADMWMFDVHSSRWIEVGLR